ncbi:hypothetical protein RF11_03698 [Thelohanellus kitauei]|uniref:Uncharacterized protein n=1 Tax=Thelohanellus kitauei TaxID=669202 RepID=A0A0C2J4J1_THEKT|nr:hypothetical protein RF11_03698 [Thelohanellus kitauei]
MEAVRNFIFHYSNQNDSKVDKLFLDYFPNDLHEEFQTMSRNETNDAGYQGTEILLLEVFTLIFRNTNVLTESKSKSFVSFFLKIIKKREAIPDFYTDPLIDSISICVSHDPYKIMFINENWMFNFYYHFIKSMNKSARRFLTICKNIYDIDHSKSCYLYHKRLRKGLKEILTKFYDTSDYDCAKILLIVFKMLNRLGLIVEMKFDYQPLLDITNSLFLRHYYKIEESSTIINLSKIWTCILNGSKSKFQIDTLDKLIILSAIFAIDLTRKLQEVSHTSGNFGVTRNKKLKFYVIYFSFVAFPIIDHEKYWFLSDVLSELSSTFQEYYENISFINIPLDDQTVIFRYYLKSCSTLKIEDFLEKHQNISRFLYMLLEDTSRGITY